MAEQAMENVVDSDEDLTVDDPLQLNQEAEVDDDFEIEIAAESENDQDGEPVEDEEVAEDSETEGEPVEEAEAEEPTDDVGEPTEPDDEDYQSFPAKVKKRIFREIKLKAKVQRELTAIKQERERAIPAIRKLVEDKQAIEAQYVGMQEQYVTLLETALDREIQVKQQQLKVAKDESNSESEVKLMSELQELVFNKRQAQEAKAGIEARKKAAPTQTTTQASTQQAPRPAANPSAERWKAKNKAWFGSPKFVAATGAARAIDQQLANEGMDKNDPEYFAELDRRLDKAFPNLRKKPTKSAPQKVAPAAQAVASAPAKKNKVVLTKADLGFMRQLGLDPSNKDHLREFARNRAAA